MRKSNFLVLFVLFTIIFGCGNRQKKEKCIEILPTDDYQLIGRKITSVDSIVIDKQYRAFLLFNYYDCGNCVDLGFSIAKKIDSLYGEKTVAVISTMGSPSLYQKRNVYYEYIYADSKDLIRKELKYVPTPIMLLLDSSNCVEKYILPNVSDDKEVALFIESLPNFGRRVD